MGGREGSNIVYIKAASIVSHDMTRKAEPRSFGMFHLLRKPDPRRDYRQEEQRYEGKDLQKMTPRICEQHVVVMELLLLLFSYNDADSD
jgi:hypothetical protein